MNAQNEFQTKSRCSRYVLNLIAIVLLFFTSTLAFEFALAEGAKKVRKTVTTVTTKEVEGDSDEDEQTTPAAAPEKAAEPVEKSKTAVFGTKNQSGMAGCKTDELAKSLIKDLKADCNAWVKDQKVELKSKFLTSSCDESCDDCGMSLRRCVVNGEIRYLLK